ncbi:sugar transferase [Synechocystis sp. LKSZ1]|uniref:sugar transferase n=1 Tax=Synechocystis sp. LKSZ1 TaxID=3144951 RepID=UPI00336C258B
MSQVQLIEMPVHFTLAEITDIHGALKELLRETVTLKRIVFDFAQTNFIDSSGVVYLRQFCQAAQRAGIELLGWSLSPQIKSLLQASHLDQWLEIDLDTEGVIRLQTEDNKDLLHPSVRSVAKRAIDIVGALVGLTVTAVLFVPVAIAIKLESPGPVLFSQLRCGHQGRTFRIWKFRSMVANAPELKHLVENQIKGAFFKNENDPRITKIGRLLRKTSLDEFPQFWNVLTGDMSLVGTRPPTLDEVAQYEPHQGKRLDVKPGLTGEWQVNGRSQVLDFEQVVALDLRYQERWSLWHDLKLIWKTVTVLLSKRSGAC